MLTTVYLYTFGISVILFFLSILLLALTLDRRLNSEFLTHPDITPLTPWLLRIINVGLCSISKYRSTKNEYMRYHYCGFDFYSFATSFEKVLVYLMLISAGALSFVCLTAYITDYFGWTDLLSTKAE